MAKAKEQKGVQNRHSYNRASYLYQAATYLASQSLKPAQDASSKSPSKSDEHSASATSNRATQQMSRHMISNLRAVSQKAQIRIGSQLKQTACKFCDTVQIEGQTCTSSVENASRGGRKPWADVLTIRCKTCGNSKRYPVSAPRQKRRSLREVKGEGDKNMLQDNETGTTTPTDTLMTT